MKEHEARRLRTIGGVGLATVIGIGAISERNTGDPFTYYQTIGEYAEAVPKVVGAIPQIISSYPDATMEEVTIVASEYLARMPRILGDYFDRYACDLPALSESVNSEQDEATEHLTNDQLHDYAREVAKKYDLTLADETEDLEKLDESENITEIISVVNSYMKNHSIIFTIPDSNKLEDFPVRFFGIAEDDLDLEKFRRDSKKLLKDFYYIPTEVTKSAGVRRVKIVGSIYHIMLKHLFGSSAFYDTLRREESGSARPGGLYNPVNEIIYITADNSGSPRLSGRVRHEVSHAVLFKVCGLFGSLSDREFASLNPKGFKYGDKFSLDSYNDISTSLFGYNNVFEDAAYVMGDLVLTFPPSKNYSTLPQTLKDKEVLNESRVEQLVPGFSNYRRKLISRLLHQP